MNEILTRLRRAWCGLTHKWTLHRGFWRCAVCQPEHRTKRMVVNEPPAATEQTVEVPLSPSIAEMSGSVDPRAMDWTYPESLNMPGERRIVTGGPLGEQAEGRVETHD